MLLLDAIGDEADADRAVLLGLRDDGVLQVIAGPLGLPAAAAGAGL
jgi:hypothetical protein